MLTFTVILLSSRPGLYVEMSGIFCSAYRTPAYLRSLRAECRHKEPHSSTSPQRPSTAQRAILVFRRPSPTSKRGASLQHARLAAPRRSPPSARMLVHLCAEPVKIDLPVPTTILVCRSRYGSPRPAAEGVVSPLHYKEGAEIITRSLQSARKLESASPRNEPSVYHRRLQAASRASGIIFFRACCGAKSLHATASTYFH